MRLFSRPAHDRQKTRGGEPQLAMPEIRGERLCQVLDPLGNLVGFGQAPQAPKRTRGAPTARGNGPEARLVMARAASSEARIPAGIP
jgi:hypothetical protein